MCFPATNIKIPLELIPLPIKLRFEISQKFFNNFLNDYELNWSEPDENKKQ